MHVIPVNGMCLEFKHHADKDLKGADFLKLSAGSKESCERECKGQRGCDAYVYAMLDGRCFLKRH